MMSSGLFILSKLNLMYKVGLLELELDEIKMQFHAVFTCCFPVIHPPELFTFSLPPINIGPSFPYTFPL